MLAGALRRSLSPAQEPVMAPYKQPSAQPVEPATGKTLGAARQWMGRVMASPAADLLCLLLVCAYGVFVLVVLAMTPEGRTTYQTEFNIVDLTFLCWFVAELLLRLFGTGLQYFSSPWNVLDAVVIVLSLASALAATSFKSVVLMRFLNLRVLLRVFPCIFVMDRMRRGRVVPVLVSTTLPTTSLGRLTSPLERCLAILQIIDSTTNLTATQRDDLRYVTGALKNGELYQPLANPTAPGLRDSVDQQTDAWFRSEFAISVNGRRAEAEIDDGSDAPDTPVVPIQVSKSAASPKARRRSLREVQRLKSMRIEQRLHGQSYYAQLKLLDDMSHTSLVYDDVAEVSNVRTSVPKQPGAAEAGAAAGAASPSAAAGRVEMSAGRKTLWNLALRNVKLRRLLKSVALWSCNIFSATQVTFGHPLYVIAYNLIMMHGLNLRLRLNTHVLQTLLSRIEAGYLTANPYHNAMHAADVVQTTNYFMTQPALFPFLQPVDILSGILAAAAHDYAHPGVNNAFEVATRTSRAVVYNDVSVLENMHCSSLFTLMTIDELNVLAPLSPEDFKRARQTIIALILGTDMAKHFEDISKFKARASGITPASQEFTPEVISTVGDAAFYLQIAVHTADVSNPAKPLTLYRRWTERVVTEFYQQGDKEREKGLPISAFFDRTTPNVPKLQMSFIDFIVQPLFTEWAKLSFDVASFAMPMLQVNRRYWERQAQIAAQTAVPIPPASPKVRRTSHQFALPALTVVSKR